MTETFTEPDAQVEDQTDDTTAQATTEAEAAAQASLEAFESAALKALEEADTSTGTIAEAHLDPVKSAYRNLEGGAKIKNRAKNFVADSMRDVLGAGDLSQMFKAVAWNNIQEAIAQAPVRAASAPKASVSPSKVYADKVQALRLALDLIEHSDLPEGVTDDWDSEIDPSDNIAVVQDYVAWLNDDSEDKGEEPIVSAVVKAAVKFATAKGPRSAGKGGTGRTYNGPKRDVAAHIINAFTGVESGTFLTVSEIRNTPSEEYGSTLPSAGAINQRLRPPSGKATTIPGIHVEQNDQGIWGATKL